MTLRADIIARERAVWDALVQGDAAADAAALDGSFLGVYPDGFAGKADHVNQLKAGPTVAAYTLEDVTVRALGPDHALISYRATFTRAGRSTPEEMYVSSLWQRAGVGWVNIFSQDTPAS
ncbi:nuclear transport factor 2 family protein [Sulfitobacter albidus]|uniref:Nuclear transport factor 2 family protein n=1 Tax=Sulfitobacter albidus TaxID=2829501 RepID=A0A975JC75_9RHOB|nr:nuclear transport factor 2 family protein [Sulfitobacter albidus]QUJ75809.1 nuclear transport factor 2 family protein [Sulfitobacter albidus]